MDVTDDNPWANAAANLNNNNNNDDEEATKSQQPFHMDAPDEWALLERRQRLRDGEEVEDVDPDSCGFKTLYQCMQIWHLFDLLFGFMIVLYGSIISSTSHHEVSDIAIVLILGIGILLLVRSICGSFALSTENLCHRCGLPISGGLSVPLAFTWFVLMFLNLIAPGHVRKYLQEHRLLWNFLQRWETNHEQTVTLILLAVFLLECCRWQLVSTLRRKLNTLEAAEDARDRERSDRRNRLADRPWWFGPRQQQQNHNSNDDDPLTESLLPVNSAQRRTRNNQPPSPRLWTFLGRPKRSTNASSSSSSSGNNYNLEYRNFRDDASVDFASVQEDWASRTEEDPYWWSRDEDSSSTAPGK